MSRPRVLFFAEAVTMAHLTRPMRLAELVDSDRYEVFFACPPQYHPMLADFDVTPVGLECMDPDEFRRKVEKGIAPFDRANYEREVAQDVVLIESVEPEVVIGDLRFSLSVSSRLKNVPYININNAYWSLGLKLPFPLPEAPIVRAVGERVARAGFSVVGPTLLRQGMRKALEPMEESFATVSLTGRFHDYRQLRIDGDVTLFCDSPELIEIDRLEPQCRFIGPVTWSTPVALPEWWPSLDPNKPWIYVALGSTGQTTNIPDILRALHKFDVEILLSTAGAELDLAPELASSATLHVAEYLPGELASAKSQLVICNGGSPAAYAALEQGVPVIGIVSNLDQVLAMAHIEQHGAGIMFRHWNLNHRKLERAIDRILSDRRFSVNATAIRDSFAAFDLRQELDQVLADLTRQPVEL